MPRYEFTRVATVLQRKEVIAGNEDEAWELMDTRPWIDDKVIDSDGIDCDVIDNEDNASR